MSLVSIRALKHCAVACSYTQFSVWMIDVASVWWGGGADGVSAFVKFGQQEGDAPLSLGITWAVEDNLQFECEYLNVVKVADWGYTR